MNTFELSRNFWNWAFDNPEIITPSHAAIYFFAVEHCNRLGGKEKFGLPSQMTMEAIGIKKHQTFIKYFNELVEYKFFKLIEKSKNQYSSNIISLIYALPKKGKAMDKANINHAAKQIESNRQSKVYIIKQDNQLTKKQDNATKVTFNFKSELIKLGISELLATEFMQVRKVKRLASTQTAFDKLTEEVAKSKRPLSEIIKICVERSWGGFNHTWDLSEGQQKQELTSQPRPTI